MKPNLQKYMRKNNPNKNYQLNNIQLKTHGIEKDLEIHSKLHKMYYNILQKTMLKRCNLTVRSIFLTRNSWNELFPMLLIAHNFKK